MSIAALLFRARLARTAGRKAGLCVAGALLLLFVALPANAQTVPLRGNLSGTAADLTSSRAPADKQLDLKIVFSLRNQAALRALLKDQQNPESPRYHKWLTPSEFQARFGPRDADVASVAQWLKSQGMQVASWSHDGRCLRVSGSVTDAERAFKTRIFAAAHGRFFANADAPSIPSRFEGVISNIEGLDNLRAFAPATDPRPARVQTSTSSMPAAAPFEIASIVEDGISMLPLAGGSVPNFRHSGVTSFGPGDMYTFYDESSVLSAGVTGTGSDCIALVEDSNYLNAAVSLFDSTFSLSAASLTNVFPTTDPGTNGDEQEALLDIEWAHAIAPSAAMRVYIGNAANATIDPIADALGKAVSENLCSAISISFAVCGGSAGYFTGTLDPLFSQAASQGQSVFVSAGDAGAAGLVLNTQTGMCATGTSKNVNEMSADQNVTSVGGTQFTPTFDSSGNDVGSVAEQVWDDSNGATGGGASTIFSKPSYQTGVTPSDGVRDVPDIAVIASPGSPGVFLGDDSSGTAVIDCCWGGTSLSAPIWAGISRLIEQAGSARLGNINTRIYQLGPSENSSQIGLRDVTSGSNSFNGVTGFTAGTGYDQATGWGSPDIAQLVAAFPSATATATPTPTPTPTLAPTATPTPSATPTPTPSPTATSSPTSTVSPTASPTPIASTPTPTDTPVPTASPAPTDTPAPTVSPTQSPAPTATPSPTPASSPTASPTPISTLTPTDTPAPTASPTQTPAPTATAAPTDTPAPTSTPSPVSTDTPVPTPAPTPAPPSPTPISSPTPTPDVDQPTVSIVSPTSTSYSVNQVVLANYSCSDPGDVVSQCIGSVPNGGNIDTSTTGPKSFTVTGTDANGNTAKQTVDYMVIPLSPASLSFGPQFVHTRSPAKTVVLTNPQASPLSISSIMTTGDFRQSNQCSPSLAPNASCTIFVRFRPRSAGLLSGSLTVTAGGTPYSVNLSGIGAEVKLFPSRITFRRGIIGSTGASRRVFLVNGQGTPLDISGMAVGGDFVANGTCGNQLAPHARCEISVAFAPTAAGDRPGWLTVNASAPIAPQAVVLSGMAIPPVSKSAAVLSFGKQAALTWSAPRKLVLTSNQDAKLAITNVTTAGTDPHDFQISGFACSGSRCVVTVRFLPLATGQKNALLVVTDSPDMFSPETATLIGTAF